MPNWCYSSYVFYSEEADEGELARLHRTIVEIMQKPSDVENGFEPGWLGKVAIAHGFDWEKIPCRGKITHIDDYTGLCSSFKLETETAWAPMDELWEAVVSRYKGVSFVYLSEESGMGIFVNTDCTGRFFPERFLLEVCLEDFVPDGWCVDCETESTCLDVREHFCGFVGLQTRFTELTDRKFDNIEDMQRYLNDVVEGCEHGHGCVYEYSFE